ncbi:hypothetical protein VN12_02355 [Pirellula sp. SH-Sr6A]|uniref:hypothetical protein n=1 Tax=Pirellula sp. SH-Sr6A TaxID=1632865 RepID=UPI00078B5969|nr:hypothetical protein [Pirellula sp. SH-Sr6A]AMV30929.1 hypothetical protein VN12_02355 [Pirellula sp. SH-Sr6A]
MATKADLEYRWVPRQAGSAGGFRDRRGSRVICQAQERIAMVHGEVGMAIVAMAWCGRWTRSGNCPNGFRTGQTVASYRLWDQC